MSTDMPMMAWLNPERRADEKFGHVADVVALGRLRQPGDVIDARSALSRPLLICIASLLLSYRCQ